MDIPPCIHDKNGARRWKLTWEADGLGDSRFTQICGREAADGGGAKKLGKDWGFVGDGISIFFSLKTFWCCFTSSLGVALRRFNFLSLGRLSLVMGHKGYS
jgi:hypothetical protein